MHTATSSVSTFLPFYKYLTVLSEQQIRQLRNMAIGISHEPSFSQQDIQVLEAKLLLEESAA
jgi:hypothetical protein